MSVVRAIGIRGSCTKGAFGGQVHFGPGVNILSARNSFGKSLLGKCIPWCFGLEPMYGIPPNEPARFPNAVRSRIKLDGVEYSVASSEAYIELFRGPTDGLRLSRPIKLLNNDPPSHVRCELISEVGGKPSRTFELEARFKTFSDQTGGLQHFLFDWLNFKKYQVMTSRREDAWLYLENLAPHFLVDQESGWSDIQALQVYRYGILDVRGSSVEAVLGADETLKLRFAADSSQAKDVDLRKEADFFVSRVNSLFQRMTWPPIFTKPSALERILSTWQTLDLNDLVERQFTFRFDSEVTTLETRISNIRRALTTGDVDTTTTTTSQAASQRVVDLKTRRHQLQESLRDLRTQIEEQSGILDSIEHRVRATRDLIRLKQDGIGRQEDVSCPTCHRAIALHDFELTDQSNASMTNYLGAAEADRKLIRRNIEAAEVARQQLLGELRQLDEVYTDASRALGLVNDSIGIAREQYARLASELSDAQRELQRIRDFRRDLNTVQDEIRTWSAATRVPPPADAANDELKDRTDFLSNQLHSFLVGFGHSEVLSDDHRITVLQSDGYAPYVDAKKLRSLGSASDAARLVTAYTLALAQTGLQFRGNHPGFVLLDEPLQQNPDPEHREKFVSAIRAMASIITGQLIIFTSLQPREIERLKAPNIHLEVRSGDYLLTAAPQPPATLP